MYLTLQPKHKIEGFIQSQNPKSAISYLGLSLIFLLALLLPFQGIATTVEFDGNDPYELNNAHHESAPPSTCNLSVNAGPDGVLLGPAYQLTAVTQGASTCGTCTKKTLVKYIGNCNDSGVCLQPVNSNSNLISTFGVCPTNLSNQYAYCNNGIISIANVHNDWSSRIDVKTAFELHEIEAKFLYPIDIQRAGNIANKSHCPTSYNLKVRFSINGQPHAVKTLSVNADQLTNKTIALDTPVIVEAGDYLIITIDGLPTSEDCDLFELAGLEVIGCTDFSTNSTTYAWSGPGISNETGNTVTVTNPGTYTVTVTDCKGCTAIDQVVITEKELPTLSISDKDVNEENGSSALIITLSEFSNQPVTVTYTIQNGTAINGDDYAAVSLSNTITIPAGQRTATVEFDLLDDNIKESTETFIITLSNPSNATIADSEGVVTIRDFDRELSIEDVTVNEEIGTAEVKVCLDQPHTRPVDFRFSTMDVSAIAPDDYTAVQPSPFGVMVSIPVGSTCGIVKIDITNDDTAEETESFKVTIYDNSSPIDVKIIDSEGVVTIVDDGLIALSVEDVTVNEEQTRISINVCLDQPAPNDVFFQYKTSDGTAVTNSDYLGLTAGSVIRKGALCKTINIAVILEDDIVESEEFFEVKLTSVTSAIDLRIDSVGIVTILDDDCPDVSIVGGERKVIISNLTAYSHFIKMEGSNGSIKTYSCRGNCNAITRGLPADTYTIEVESYDENNNLFCTETFDNIEVVDCPNVSIVGGVRKVTISNLTAAAHHIKFEGSNGYTTTYFCQDNCNAITRFLPADTYSIQVQSFDESMHVFCTETFTATVTSQSSGRVAANISTSTNTSEISLFPIPATDLLHVNLGSLAGQAGVLYLSNSIGQVVKEVTIPSFEVAPTTLDVGQISGGLYHLTIVAEGALITTQKVVIQQR